MITELMQDGAAWVNHISGGNKMLAAAVAACLMANLSKRDQEIFDIIEAETCKQTETPWKQMSQAVRDAGMNVKNWMEVRSVLQFMLNEKILKRTDSITVEHYVRAQQ